MSQILVTGANGYLGGQVLSMLRKYGANVLGVGRSERCDLVCDLCDSAATAALIAQYSDCRIIHCAAVVPKSQAGYFDEEAAAKSLEMVRNLANARPRQVVFASSMTVYPDGVLRAREGDAVSIGKGYAASKLEAEGILQECFDTTATILRFPGLFGLPRKGGVLFNSALALARGDAPVLEESLPQWAAMHVEDAAELCIRATSVVPECSMVMNVGYPERMAIADAIARLAALSGRELSVPEPKWFEFDLSRLHAVLGPVSGSFDDRLSDLAAWARKEIRDGHNA